jgi:hypothetical protein
MSRTLTLLLLAAAVPAAVGCKCFETPRSLRGSERPDRCDLPIDEQERRGRARYGLHDDDFRVGPNTFTERVSPTGVGR